ncbi:MAG: restriction endonuclease [Nitrospirae bacterium]|nr:restriction endonuclease [Nitrospirota bacterium]
MIIKASGLVEEFDRRKLVDSLMRSGASEDAALDIAKKVEIQITPSTHTKHIFKMAKRLLRQYNHASGMRYSIKKAIADLGPSGYPFEKYFGKILKNYGYSVELNRIVEGWCVSHEVDVFAGKGDERFVIECKYHSNGGKPADVKVALYVHSRFMDIRKAFESNGAKVDQGWLVTNTRCTSDAIKYAECVGLKIVSWKYPHAGSLEEMIEAKRLYPITVLSSVKRNSLETLFHNDIILVQDIADMDESVFIKRSGLDAHNVRALKRQADDLCG